MAMVGRNAAVALNPILDRPGDDPTSGTDDSPLSIRLSNDVTPPVEMLE
jgi:hypothetical protein